MARLSELQRQHIKTIIIGADERSVNMLIEEAESIGNQLAVMKFASGQIRNIFGVVRSIEQRVDRDQLDNTTGDVGKQHLADTTYRELLLIKPKLAYQYGRATNSGGDRKKDGMELLKETLSLAIDQVERDRDRFKRFVEFFEAILAYHRCRGGKS